MTPAEVRDLFGEARVLAALEALRAEPPTPPEVELVARETSAAIEAINAVAPADQRAHLVNALFRGLDELEPRALDLIIGGLDGEAITLALSYGPSGLN